MITQLMRHMAKVSYATHPERLYEEQTKPCDICVNGIITIPDGKGGIHQAPCPRCGGTGRLPK